MRSGNRQITLALCILIANQNDWTILFTNFNHNICSNKLKNNFNLKLNAIAFKPMSDDVRQPANNGSSFYTNWQSKWLAYFTIFWTKYHGLNSLESDF